MSESERTERTERKGGYLQMTPQMQELFYEHNARKWCKGCGCQMNKKNINKVWNNEVGEWDLVSQWICKKCDSKRIISF